MSIPFLPVAFDKVYYDRMLWWKPTLLN